MPCFYAFINNNFVIGRFLVCVSVNLKYDYIGLLNFYDKKDLSLRFVYANCIEDEMKFRDDVFNTFLYEGLYE